MHNDHSSHPDVDRLFCRNGTRIVVGGSTTYRETVTIDGTEFTSGMEVGRDCSGATRADKTGLKSEPAIGLVEMLSGTGGGKWPKVSKEATWGVSGAFLDNWGRSEEVREAETEKVAEKEQFGYMKNVRMSRINYRTGNTEAQLKAIDEWRDKQYKTYEWKARTSWLAANPGWLDEERRRLEVDASSQVAGEIADMGPDRKCVVAVD